MVFRFSAMQLLSQSPIIGFDLRQTTCSFSLLHCSNVRTAFRGIAQCAHLCQCAEPCRPRKRKLAESGRHYFMSQRLLVSLLRVERLPCSVEQNDGQSPRLEVRKVTQPQHLVRHLRGYDCRRGLNILSLPMSRKTCNTQYVQGNNNPTAILKTSSRHQPTTNQPTVRVAKETENVGCFFL